VLSAYAQGFGGQVRLRADYSERVREQAVLKQVQELYRLYQLIVIFMGANAHPFDDAAYEVTNSAMTIAYTD
jgi:hypothetical protein